MLYKFCCSVSKSCLTLCSPMDCSMPGFPVLHYLSEFAQTHVHWADDAIQSISSSVAPFSFCPQSFPPSGSFPMSQLFASGGQSIGASASASFLPVNIQDWFSLRLTGLMCLRSKRFPQVFSSTTLRNHQFFSAQPSFTSMHDYWKNHSIYYTNLFWENLKSFSWVNSYFCVRIQL